VTTVLDQRNTSQRREAAEGVERHDVDAVNRAEVRQLYAGRQKV
jgi:hypothetical protein